MIIEINMSNLKRYGFHYDDCGDYSLGEFDDGEYIKFDDIKKLLNIAYNKQSTPLLCKCGNLATVFICEACNEDLSLKLLA